MSETKTIMDVGIWFSRELGVERLALGRGGVEILHLIDGQRRVWTGRKINIYNISIIS